MNTTAEVLMEVRDELRRIADALERVTTPQVVEVGAERVNAEADSLALHWGPLGICESCEMKRPVAQVPVEVGGVGDAILCMRCARGDSWFGRQAMADGVLANRAQRRT